MNRGDKFKVGTKSKKLHMENIKKVQSRPISDKHPKYNWPFKEKVKNDKKN